MQVLPVKRKSEAITASSGENSEPSGERKSGESDLEVEDKNSKSSVTPNEVPVVITEKNGSETAVERKEETTVSEDGTKKRAGKFVFNPYKKVRMNLTGGKVASKSTMEKEPAGVISDSEVLAIDLEKASQDARKKYTKKTPKV